MKQRLLLSLLMLFVSVGLVKAADNPIKIVIPNGEKVTVTFGGSFSATSYPVIKEGTGQQAQQLTPTTTGNPTTYTIESKGTDFMLQPAYDATWGNVTISLSGKVSQFIADDKTALSEKVTSLSFTNNGELSALQLGNGSQRTTDNFPALTSLSCSGNKLQFIPSRMEGGKKKITSYNVGEQTFATGTLSGISNKGIVLDNTIFNKAQNGSFSPAVPNANLSIIELDGNGQTVKAIADSKEPNRYYFKNGDIFMDGNFTAKIKVSDNDDNYPGVIVCGVPIEVSPAEFTLKYESDNNGTLESATTNGATVKKGASITFTPKAKEGYTFKGFEQSTLKGLTAEESDGNKYPFTVTGDEAPYIKALFTAGAAKVTYITPQEGNLLVRYKNGAEINNGDEVAVGSEVVITIKAPKNMIIDPAQTIITTQKGQSIAYTDEDESQEGLKATITVGADGLNIKAAFADAVRVLTIEYSGLSSLSVKDKTGYEYASGNISGKTENVKAGTELKVTFKLQDKNAIPSVLFGTDAKTPSLVDGTYEVNVVMPNNNITLKISATERTGITVTPKATQLTYDGTEQKLEFTTSPANVGKLVVKYMKQGEDEAQASEKAFKNAGSYTAIVSREADEQFAVYKKSFNYTIGKANLVVTQAPTVSVDKDTKKYTITGGSVGYKRGDAIVTDSEVTGTFKALDGTGAITETEPANANGRVTLRFYADEMANFNAIDGNNGVADVEVVYGSDIKKATVKVADGSAPFTMKVKGQELKDDGTVYDGQLITFEFTADPKVTAEGGTYELQLLNEQGVSIETVSLDNGYTVNLSGGRTEFTFNLKVNDKRKELALTSDSKKTQTYTYTGEAITFNVKAPDFKVVVKGTETYPGDTDWEITYKQGNDLVPQPINVGTYDVVLVRPATNYYFEFKVEDAKLVIEQATIDPSMVKPETVTATQIAKGQALSKSHLSGDANIAGEYQWATEVASVKESAPYGIKFVPENKNYADLQLKQTVTVPVTDDAIITYSTVKGLGYVTVTDETGYTYISGEEVDYGRKLTVTATAAEDYELESLYVDGVLRSVPYSFTFGDETIDIEASFRVKTTVLPGNFKVTIPEGGVRGAIITGGGDHVVAQGGSISFTVSTLAADANKVSVTATNGTVSKGSNGRYTVSNIQANTTVRVSLSNPTALKVDIKESYLNDKKYHIGYVEIADGEATTYYYGDEITVVAYPESGVKFKGWSNGSTDQVLDLTLTGDLTLTASFTGTPTGIEDIETAKVYTGKGFIMVKNVANAEVTVVSISGRLQAKREISGDTQIMVPQGIYVVVLQSGDDTKQLKVIVK